MVWLLHYPRLQAVLKIHYPRLPVSAAARRACHSGSTFFWFFLFDFSAPLFILFFLYYFFFCIQRGGTARAREATTRAERGWVRMSGVGRGRRAVWDVCFCGWGRREDSFWLLCFWCCVTTAVLPLFRTPGAFCAFRVGGGGAYSDVAPLSRAFFLLSQSILCFLC